MQMRSGFLCPGGLRIRNNGEVHRILAGMVGGRKVPSIHRATERAPGRRVVKATANTEIKRALRVYGSIMDRDSSPALTEPSPDPPSACANGRSVWCVCLASRGALASHAPVHADSEVRRD